MARAFHTTHGEQICKVDVEGCRKMISSIIDDDDVLRRRIMTHLFGDTLPSWNFTSII